jgi:dodecin
LPPGFGNLATGWLFLEGSIASQTRRKPRAVVKVIELLGESEESWEDATRQVVAEATRTLHGVTSVYVKEFQATVENDKVKNFRVNAKVSFILERK